MLDLEPIKNRIADGTPGPWECLGNTVFIDQPGAARRRYWALPGDWQTAALIANAPADLAALLAEVERLRDGLVAVAVDLQGLGHATPWNYGRALRRLVEPPDACPPAPSHAKEGACDDEFCSPSRPCGNCVSEAASHRAKEGSTDG